MTLASNLLSTVQAIGADVKALSAVIAPPAQVSDWTYLISPSDTTSVVTTATDITGLGVMLTPGTYEVEGMVMVQTATATTGPQVGMAWPANCTGAFRVDVPSSATANVTVNGVATGGKAAGTGLATANASYLAIIKGLFVVTTTLASPGLRPQLYAELAATGTVTAKAGSVLKYRRVDAAVGQANRIQQITAAAYAALVTKDASTLYVIVG